MPTGFRILKSKYASNAFDGEGAKKYGGRWNSPGYSAIYTAQSESLAVLEVLVNIQDTSILKAYSIVSAEFDNQLIEAFDASQLPHDWKISPVPSTTQQIGDKWISEQRSAVLQLPSVIIPNESIFILNPNHPDFRQIKVSSPNSFEFDSRLK